MAVDSHVWNEWCIYFNLAAFGEIAWDKIIERNKVETSTGISMFVPVQQIKKNKKNELLEYSEF